MSREAIADEVYARIRELLELMPEAFFATRDGLAVPSSALDEHVLRLGSADAILKASAVAAVVRDGWLLRSTFGFWLMHPEAFGFDQDVLPARVVDRRSVSAGAAVQSCSLGASFLMPHRHDASPLTL